MKNNIPSDITCVDEGKIEDFPPVFVLSAEHPQVVLLVLARITQDTVGGLHGGSVPQGSGGVGVGHHSQAEKSPSG